MQSLKRKSAYLGVDYDFTGKLSITEREIWAMRQLDCLGRSGRNAEIQYK